MGLKSDIEIAQESTMLPIEEIDVYKRQAPRCPRPAQHSVR